MMRTGIGINNRRCKRATAGESGNGALGHTVIAMFLAAFAPAAFGGSIGVGDEGTFKYSLSSSYGASLRMEDPYRGIINSPGREEIPITETLKYPESNNHDDGDRNFSRGSLVNNRLTFLGELEFQWRDFGILVRADGFYDTAYHGGNDYATDYASADCGAPSPADGCYDDPPESRINTTQDPFNSFTDEADLYAGGRTRFLDAYAYGTFYLGDTMSLALRAGRHIAAWGQSLFFYGVALSQATADATKATVPGADVKSILLPINQVSARFVLTDSITLLGQYQFEFKEFELNPVGEFYSVADIVGPGAEFAFGIRNPFDPDTLGDLASELGDPTLTDTICNAFNPDGSGTCPVDLGPAGPALGALSGTGVLDPVGDVITAIAGATLDVSPGLNPNKLAPIKPDSSDKQFGIGAEWAVTFTTTLGAYYLRYHQKTPAPTFNFPHEPGTGLVLIPGQLGGGPDDPTEVDTVDIQLYVPASYQIKYFDNVDLFAVGISTVLFGLNVGGEIIHRRGADILVDVNEGIGGTVPTPSRADTSQLLVNAIYTTGPKLFWDTFTLVAEVGYARADNIEGATSGSQAARVRNADEFGMGATDEQRAAAAIVYDEPTFDRHAAAFALLSFIDKRNVFPGWDLQIPISLQGAVWNRSPLNGAFGSLFGEDDYRFGIAFNFTRLQNLQLGIGYSAFVGGKGDFLDRPLQDRDVLFISGKYNIF